MSGQSGAYPRCTERKIRLSGEEVSFECELLAYEDDLGIVRYVIERERTIDGIVLPAGTVTLGLYYSDRPYNLYYWIAPRQGPDETAEDPWRRDIAYYFNVVEPIEVSREMIAYRDLVVDVLVLPDGRARPLDESELPDSLDESLRDRIISVRDDLLVRHTEIIEEARRVLLPYALEL